MRIWLWTYNKWEPIAAAPQNYLSMVYNALCMSHPNLHFCYQVDKPTHEPPKVTIQQAMRREA